MKELYNAGLIKRVQGRDADGNWNKEVAYIFTDNNDLLDTELKLNKLEKQQIKQLENDLKARFENETAESQNLKIEKFATFNNTNLSNNTKKDLCVPKHEAKVKQSKQYKSFRERYKDFDYEA